MCSSDFLLHISDPTSLLFEITSKLEPLHVLHLSRVSRQFMNVLANPNARHVWVAARRNIPDLPDCPTDMTEMQYASLLFERTCYVCTLSIDVAAGILTIPLY